MVGTMADNVCDFAGWQWHTKGMQVIYDLARLAHLSSHMTQPSCSFCALQLIKSKISIIFGLERYTSNRMIR